MISDSLRQQICTAIEEKRPTLVEQVVTDLWADPFWEDRYGTRGKRFFYEDGHYHIDTLVTSIQMDLPEFMGQHYTWLKGVLVHRGMCSRHLQQTLAVFNAQLSVLLPQYWEMIRPYAEAAYDGLSYTAPACQALALAEEQLGMVVTQRILQERPEWAKRLGAEGQALCCQDIRYHLSYLQDALGYQEPRIFTDYLNWISAYLEARHQTPQMLHLTLRYLEEEMERSLPTAAAAPALQLLRSIAAP